MNEQRQSLSVPIAIIIAGALIAFGIYWSGRSDQSGSKAVQETESNASSVIKFITADDHVLGDRKAPIVIIEYSDVECPFCKQFHTTLHKLMEEYGTKGKLAWSYRHFPVHKNSVKEGEALECAAELGGNEAFWKYADNIFETTTSNDTLDLSKLPAIASQVGIDAGLFKACLDSGKHAARVEADKQAMIDASVEGTPYSAIFLNGELIHEVREGALPYDLMRSTIETILAEI